MLIQHKLYLIKKKQQRIRVMPASSISENVCASFRIKLINKKRQYTSTNQIIFIIFLIGNPDLLVCMCVTHSNQFITTR